MNKIKFSHDYEKLPVIWKGTQAILWSVIRIEDVHGLKERFPQFIERDTKIRGKDEHYPLDMKEAIILFFTHINTGITFTTIRRYTPEKMNYYQKEQGNTFIMELVP